MKKFLSSLVIGFLLFAQPAFASITFDGTNDSLSTTGNVTFGTNIITVTFWANIASFADDDKQIMELTSNYNNTDHSFVINPDGTGTAAGKFYAAIQDSATTNKYLVVAFTRPSTSVDHFYTFILDNSTNAGAITIYVDAAVQSTTTTTNTKNQNGNFVTDKIYFGSRGNASAFKAFTMTECAIFKGSLSQSQINELYLMPKYRANSLDRTNLLAYWPMDEGASGTIPTTSSYIRDLSENGNHATQTGGPVYAAEPAALVYKTQLFTATEMRSSSLY